MNETKQLTAEPAVRKSINEQKKIIDELFSTVNKLEDVLKFISESTPQKEEKEAVDEIIKPVSDNLFGVLCENNRAIEHQINRVKTILRQVQI